MKTLIKIILTLSVSGFLMAQTDSTATQPINTTEVEALAESADSTAMPAEEIAVTDSMVSDSVFTESLEMDSTLVDSSFFAETDTLEIIEPEMVEIQNDPVPVVVTGLTNLGPLYFWSTDGLMGLNLEFLDYVTILDPVLIAVKAADCNDIVCHLLATDSSDVDYVIVTPEDSSDYRIYDTDTKVVVLEAPGSDLAVAFDAFLKDLAGTSLIAVVPADTAFVGPVLTDDLGLEAARMEKRKKSLRIRNRQFRSMDQVFDNPANLARNFNTYTSWNLVPNFNVSVHNSLLTPGWYSDWWTIGGVWDDVAKADYLSTIMDKNMAINISPDFQSLFGFRIGRFGLNLSGISHIEMNLPGNMLGLPMQDILFDEPIENGGLEIEAVPFVAKATLSYAHPVKTAFGELKVGLGINMYEAAGYMHVVSDDFTVLMSQDSVQITASGEGWVTNAGIEGRLEDTEAGDLDPMSALSNIGVGIDLGVIMDLEDYLKQEVEVQVSLRNIGAQYKWSDVTHSAWTMDMVLPTLGPDELDTLDIEEYQTTTDSTLSTNGEITIDVPTLFKMAAVYQPIPQVMIGVGLEKALIDESQFGYSPDLELNYQLNLYAASWIDFSYYKHNQYGDPVHTFGSGLHFGFLDTGFTLSFFNGLNTEAKGIGVGLRSSLHF